MKKVPHIQNRTKSITLIIIFLAALLLGVFIATEYSSEKSRQNHNININNSENVIHFENSRSTQTEQKSKLRLQTKTKGGVEQTEKPTFQSLLVEQAELRLQSPVTYNGRYEKIAYPMGDVQANIGVCTDVVIRSYRGLGIDLQQRVHEDMRANFQSYPKKWRLKRPDTNIDHRRVPNLMTYFKRAGASLPISKDPYDYEKGHIVTWDIGKGLVHIGIVSDKLSMITGHPLIIHNIGAGPEMTDILFRYKITGHYQYGSSAE